MSSVEQSSLDNPLVYVVDDDVYIADLVFHTLKTRGYEVKPFYRGESMLEGIKDDDPDLIILDVMMPGTNGVEVARQVREFSQVPIIMLSVRNDVNTKATALDTGADDYLTKPFEIEELVARVRAILRRTNSARNSHYGSIYQTGNLCIDLENALVR